MDTQTQFFVVSLLLQNPDASVFFTPSHIKPDIKNTKELVHGPTAKAFSPVVTVKRSACHTLKAADRDLLCKE